MYYTSGTTGKPKGVVLSHRVVVHHAVGTIKGEAGPRAAGMRTSRLPACLPTLCACMRRSFGCQPACLPCHVPAR